jgi:hypothetical protein
MPDDEARQRYHRAAEVALEQLDWCIRYLRQIGKHDISNVLSRNRAHIDRRMRMRTDSDAGTKR